MSGMSTSGIRPTVPCRSRPGCLGRLPSAVLKTLMEMPRVTEPERREQW
jgi:hypothetical protein